VLGLWFDFWDTSAWGGGGTPTTGSGLSSTLTVQMTNLLHHLNPIILLTLITIAPCLPR
jgi:hypothetical protein